MSATPEPSPALSENSPAHPERSAPEAGAASKDEPLAVEVYQIVNDALILKNRTDGTGWALQWADLKREWMERTSQKFVYRCLPLTMANQLGFFVLNPVGFTARWLGTPDKVQFTFDTAADTWSKFVTNNFGYGIITWHTPYLFRTRPRGSRMLVMGPANGTWKALCHPLTGLLESDWMTMSFTMNWQILQPGVDVRFERGEPLFQAIPLARDPCFDIENASVVLRRLDDNPDLARDYRTWSESRETFHRMQKQGQAAQGDWQKHYFRGMTIDGGDAPTLHYTRIRTPEIVDETNRPPPPVVQPKPIVGIALRVGGGSPVSVPSAGGLSATTFGEAQIHTPRRDPRFAAMERAGGPEGEAPAPSVVPEGGFRLKVWRVHPEASRVARAGAEPAGNAAGKPTSADESASVARARAAGFWVFPPADLDVTWDGGDRFRHEGRGLDDEDRARMEAIGVDPPYDPPEKLALGADGEGVVTIWTGLIAETPPGWMLAVRAPSGAAGAGARVVDEIIASDEGPREVVVRLRLEAGKPLALRAREPWPPLAQLVPVRREGFEEEWMLSQMPLGKAAKDAEEIYVKWMAGRAM